MAKFSRKDAGGSRLEGGHIGGSRHRVLVTFEYEVPKSLPDFSGCVLTPEGGAHADSYEYLAKKTVL
jgi:hypothetical protein